VTKEEAERRMRSQLKLNRGELDWLNDPRSWPERNRPLTPAEIAYSRAALEFEDDR
jgi:hypothetical protein